jgi:hypothetical protein
MNRNAPLRCIQPLGGTGPEMVRKTPPLEVPEGVHNSCWGTELLYKFRNLDWAFYAESFRTRPDTRGFRNFRGLVTTAH